MYNTNDITDMFRFSAPLSLVLAAVLLLAGCGLTDADDDHKDAAGFVIVQDNQEIVRFENNLPIWNPNEAWDAYYREDMEGIVLSPDVLDFTEANPRGMTPSVTIRWIDRDGDLFDLANLSEEEGGEYWLNWQWKKPNVPQGVTCSDEAREDIAELDFIRPANLEQHVDEDGQWSFHFRADHAGQDRVRFRLMHGHGSAAHSDFASEWMDVTVAHEEDHPLIDENGIYHHDRDKCRTDRPRE